MQKLLLLIFVSLCLQFCGNDLLEPVCDGTATTYDNDISNIINDTCNSASCHGSGASNGEWTSYKNLEAVLNNGDFEKFVLTEQTMPKGTGSLSQDEIDLIQCWMEQGYPEN